MLENTVMLLLALRLAELRGTLPPERIAELGIGQSARERNWAAWGFAAGFATNTLIAKYAQMTSAAPMSQFIGPMLLGGVLAGAACGAIGWGLARLRER